MTERPKKKRPADVNRRAKSIVDELTGQTDESEEPTSQQAEAGRLGASKGGQARASKLTKEQRAEIAKMAAAARWNSKDD